jgi:hypothetical protein
MSVRLLDQIVGGDGVRGPITDVVRNQQLYYTKRDKPSTLHMGSGRRASWCTGGRTESRLASKRAHARLGCRSVCGRAV